MNPEQQPEQPVEQPFEQPLEQSVAQPPIQPVAAPTPPPKPKKKWLLPLLIVLGVIVLGGVAYAGYALGTSEKASKQTSNTNATDSTDKANEETSAITLKDGGIDSRFPASITWQYPEDWTVSTTPWGTDANGKDLTPAPGETAMQRITITSPSKKYSVSYEVMTNAARGWVCPPEDIIQRSYSNVTLRPVAGFTEANFASYISESKEGRLYRGSLMNKETIKTSGLKEGLIDSSDAGCGLYTPSIFSITDTDNMYLWAADINLLSLEKTGESETTFFDTNTSVESIKAAMATDEYKQAVAILLSTKVAQ